MMKALIRRLFFISDKKRNKIIKDLNNSPNFRTKKEIQKQKTNSDENSDITLGKTLDTLKNNVNNQIPKSILNDYAMLKGLQAKKSSKYIATAELAMHSKIVQSDLSILIINYKKATTEMEKKFHSRISSIIIFEYLSDVNFLLGNKLTKELIKNNFMELAETSKQLNKEFSLLKKENLSSFKFIRNQLGAHKSKNTEFLITSLFEVDDEKIMDLTADLTLINNQLFKLLTNIYKSISEYHKLNGIIKN
ncbi:hypothetical protein [Tenacibaculum finnmarkense]|uniref:hypothetical protein n=1 Tax=Tenacibaculum finnmarkense TaxID=2781243 RepID=UPI001EFB4627|nr:hypothetical protein [Tenacibaculum finnmarkense]MCG8734466.1 hypothetical protein [Tenacibaculum finnmarkense]